MNTIKRALKNVYDAVGDLYRREPARVVAFVLAGFAALSIVVNPLLVALAFAALYGGEVVRQNVTPVAKAEAKEQAAIEAAVTPKPRKQRKAPAKKR